MTENKRFTYEEVNFCNDNLTGKQYDLTNPNEMLELLNEQHETITKLEKENTELRMITDLFSDRELRRLQKENKQLKQALNRNIEIKEFLLEEELKLNDTVRSFIMEHNKERYK